MNTFFIKESQQVTTFNVPLIQLYAMNPIDNICNVFLFGGISYPFFSQYLNVFWMLLILHVSELFSICYHHHDTILHRITP